MKAVLFVDECLQGYHLTIAKLCKYVGEHPQHQVTSISINTDQGRRLAKLYGVADVPALVSINESKVSAGEVTDASLEAFFVSEKHVRANAPACKLQHESSKEALNRLFEEGIVIESINPLKTTETTNSFDALGEVLQDALIFMTEGKGAERHGNNKPLNEQPITCITNAVGPGFALGQVAKKAMEAGKMTPEAAERELLGAITYAAFTILWLRQQQTAHTNGHAKTET